MKPYFSCMYNGQFLEQKKISLFASSNRLLEDVTNLYTVHNQVKQSIKPALTGYSATFRGIWESIIEGCWWGVVPTWSSWALRIPFPLFVLFIAFQFIVVLTERLVFRYPLFRILPFPHNPSWITSAPWDPLAIFKFDEVDKIIRTAQLLECCKKPQAIDISCIRVSSFSAT